MVMRDRPTLSDVCVNCDDNDAVMIIVLTYFPSDEHSRNRGEPAVFVSPANNMV